MTINPLASSLTSTFATSAGPGSQTATTGVPSQKITTQDFMTLLTTQLQNQDPTNPVDPTQFVAQLAQFVTLDQVTQINQAVQDFVQSNTRSSTSQSSSSSALSSAGASGMAQFTPGTL